VGVGRGSGFLFSASHGAAFDREDADQRRYQGAIVGDDDLFAHDRLNDDVCLPAGVAFFFACYGAGTPSHSECLQWCPQEHRARLVQCQAEKDFLAALPMGLLGHRHPALAVIAHIDPAWHYSFMEPQTWQRRTGPFELAVQWIVRGVPVGHAMKDFNVLHGTLSTILLQMQLDYDRQRILNQMPSPVWDERLLTTWLLRTDAQNFIVLGDPAVRLRMAP
jgi:hypothetical protein